MWFWLFSDCANIPPPFSYADFFKLIQGVGWGTNEIAPWFLFLFEETVTEGTKLCAKRPSLTGVIDIFRIKKIGVFWALSIGVFRTWNFVIGIFKSWSVLSAFDAKFPKRSGFYTGGYYVQIGRSLSFFGGDPKYRSETVSCKKRSHHSNK